VTSRGSAAPPLIDLVLPTIGRTTELERFLASLAAQSYRSFRLILVDQNEDDRLSPILSPYEDAFPLIRLVSQPGASRARNAGLREIEGDLVGFPDDDCWYPANLLETVVEQLAIRAELDGIGGRTIDEAERSSFVRWADADQPQPITHANVWRTAVAVTIFFRRPVVDAVGGFDEALGVGAGTRWGSGEETDYVLRALAAGFRIGYDPGVTVFHESPDPPFSRVAARKGFAYGMGHSRVLRRHGFGRSFAAYRIAQLVGAAAYFVARGQLGRARFYWAMAVGRAAGWLAGAK
jgi:GT2 family glycosyltransferase